VWAALATLSGAIVLGAVIFWTFRDRGWPFGPESLSLGQKLATGNDKTIPIVDNWRLDGYRVPDWRDNWPARIVGFSYILAGAKYYQGIFSGLMPLQGRLKGFAGWRSIAAEAMIRLQTIAAPVLVATTVFLQAKFWPIASAIGQVIIVFCNFIVWSFAARSIRDARGSNIAISTAGTDASRIVGLEAFREWVPSSGFYAVVVLCIGSLIYIGVLHDIAVYAAAVAATNVFLFYLIKCGKGGRDIRVGLARGFLAAERLRVWHENNRLRSDASLARPVSHASTSIPAQSAPREETGDRSLTDQR
jgi:hypothetical protein